MGIGDAINKAVDQVKDAVGQTTHETKADAEHAKRDTAGDTMTTSDKAGSLLTEGKENFLGGVDKTKQDVRSEV